MAAIESTAGALPVAAARTRSAQLRLIQTLACLGAGALVWLAPLPVTPHMRATKIDNL
ncbi:MAG: hypothetical protein KGO48_06540 [Alphaproteobacteria bacterium]|nr:hypothetical protein [Alphaproteobacteria bacterium]